MKTYIVQQLNEDAHRQSFLHDILRLPLRAMLLNANMLLSLMLFFMASGTGVLFSGLIT